MSVALTVTVVVITSAVAVLVLAGLVRACLDMRRRKPVPPRIWVALVALTVFAAAGVFILITQGRGHRLLPLFTIAVVTLGLVYSRLARREVRGEAYLKDAD